MTDYINGRCVAVVAWSPELAGINFTQYVFCHDWIHLLVY
jgi:hypothetical protein